MPASEEVTAHSGGDEEMMRALTLCGFRHPLVFGTDPLRMRGWL